MKSIKIILLSFSLTANLAVTSYAMSKNKTTIVSNYNLRNSSKNHQSNLEQIQHNENKTAIIPRYNFREKPKNVQYSESKNKISTSSKNNNDMEIDTSKEKNVNITTQEKYDNISTFYHKVWQILKENQHRKYIVERLQNFKKLSTVMYKNIKNMSEMSISNFNTLQSILLDYYNFSVLFNTKYSPVITLMRTYKGNYVIQKSIDWKNFKQLYFNFIYSITKYVKTLNDFCCKILFDNNFNVAIQNAYVNNINTKNDEDEKLNEKTLEQLSSLTADLQEIFHNTQTEMTPQSTLWGKTFSIDQFTNNNFIDEDTAYNKFEVTPDISQDYEIPIALKNQIPDQYKINNYILAAVYKMELLKSQYYMKKLKDNPSNNENTENIFKSYDEAKKYANDIFKTYNSLRSFIVLDKGLSSIDSDDQDNTSALASNIFLKVADAFDEVLKQYASNSLDKIDDIINLSITSINKNLLKKVVRKYILEFITKSDFKNKYQINSIPNLYDHLVNNKESYNHLFAISNVKDLKEFYLKINKENINSISNSKSTNIKSNCNTKTTYQSLNKFLDSDTINYLKNKTKKNNLYTSRKYNVGMAEGLLKYYDNNWNLDKDIERRKNIIKRLNEFNTIYNIKDKIQNNATLLNENFNSLQSILLDYYKFLLFFSKYNNLIKMITTKTYKMQNYNQIKDLPEYDTFLTHYKTFTELIKGQVAKIKKFVKEILTENFKDPENTDNITPETNLTQLLKMSEEILKLEPNFKEIFKIMGIDQITDEKVLDEKTSLEDIDVIPKIDENKAYLKLHSINAAPPHYRVNLDILATVLKMEILKWLPYFKKMPNTTILNDQENNTDINFTQSKKKMSDYINKIYKFYDKLKSYMVWSMNDLLFYVRNSGIYSANQNFVNKRKYPIRIDEIMGEEENFMKKIQAYIKDDKQFYTTFYLAPDESENSSKAQSKKPSTKKEKKVSSKQPSVNLFKLYYDRRQDCVDKDISQITLFTKHILKKQKIYDNFINNNNPNISDMKLLDQFFSKLDPGYFTILSKVNANKNNPTFIIHKNILLKENKNNKKSIAEQLKKTKLQINTNQNSLTYNNDSNHLPIFQKNNNKFTRYNINKNNFNIFNDKSILFDRCNVDSNNDDSFSLEDLNNSKDLYLQQLFEQNYNYDSDKNDQNLNILFKSHNFEQMMCALPDDQNDMNHPVYMENCQIDLSNQTAKNRLSSKFLKEQTLQNNNVMQKENDFIKDQYPPFYNENEPFMFDGQNHSVDCFNEPFMFDGQNHSVDCFDIYDNYENYKLLDDQNEVSLYLDELIKINTQNNDWSIEKNAQQTSQNHNNFIKNNEGLTQINRNQNKNKRKYIQNNKNEDEEGFNSDATYNLDGKKGKNSKKTKYLLNRKTSRNKHKKSNNKTKLPETKIKKTKHQNKTSKKGK